MKHLLVYAATKFFNVFLCLSQDTGSNNKKREKKMGGCKDRYYTQIYDMTLDISAECHVSRKNKQILKTLSLLEARCPAYMQRASTSALDTRSLLRMCSITSISARDTRFVLRMCKMSVLPIFLRHDFKEVNYYYYNNLFGLTTLFYFYIFKAFDLFENLFLIKSICFLHWCTVNKSK